MCVMRTAEYVVLTLWPPGPLEQKVSIRRSFVVDLDVDFLAPPAVRRRWPWTCGCGRSLRSPARAARGGRRSRISAGCRRRALRSSAMTSFKPPTPLSLLRQHVDLPALPLGVARVHAEEVGREERRFVAAGAGADFEDDVLRVVRILRDEQHLQLGEQRVAALLEAAVPPAPVPACRDRFEQSPGRRRARPPTSLYSRNFSTSGCISASAFECARNFAASAWTAGSAISVVSCSYLRFGRRVVCRT